MNIEQAIYGSRDAGGYRFLAKSLGFRDDWLAAAERLCTGFGEPTPGAWCPLAIFAVPFDSKHVAVVQVSEQGRDDTGRPGALCFRLLIIPTKLYLALDADPFWISDQLPPDWTPRGYLPTVELSNQPPPRRIAELKRVLDVEAEHTQMLLGGVQILVDGGRLAFARTKPDERVVRDLWALLPTGSRLGIWPATFAFVNRHRFHLVVTPNTTGPEWEGYTSEQQAGDYPEGRYELALQHAVESGDEGEVVALLSRRGQRQTLWLAAILLVGFVLAAMLINAPWGGKVKPDEQEKPNATKDELKLRPIAEVPSLPDEERKTVAKQMQQLAKALGIRPPNADSDAGIADWLARFDERLDEKLGDKKPSRQLEPFGRLGPARRRLEAIAWKYGVKEYNNTQLNAAELLERLQERLTKMGVLKEMDRE